MTHRSRQTPLTHASLTCSYILCDTLCAFQAYCISLLLNKCTVARGRNFFVWVPTLKELNCILCFCQWFIEVQKFFLIFTRAVRPALHITFGNLLVLSLSVQLIVVYPIPTGQLPFVSYLRLLIRIFMAAFYEVQCSLKQHYSTFVFSVFIFKSFS